MRCTRLPDFWNYNTLRVEGPAPALEAAAIVAAADRWLGDLPHRQVEVEDAATGRRLRPAVRRARLGDRADRVDAARRRRRPAGPTSPRSRSPPRSRCGSSGRSRCRGARTRRPSAASPAPRRWWPGSAACARCSRATTAGAPIGFAVFAARGDGAEIDSAFVRPDHRGRGLGGALVAAAARTTAAARLVHRRRRRGRAEAALPAARLRAGLDAARLHASALDSLERGELRDRLSPVAGRAAPPATTRRRSSSGCWSA